MWPEGWIIGEACHNCATLNFDSCNSQDIRCLCKNKDYLATVALCISEYAEFSTDRDSAWDHFSSSACEIHNAKIEDRDFNDAILYLNHTKVKDLPLPSNAIPSREESWPKTPPVQNPVSISAYQFNITYNAVYNFLNEKDVSVWQGSFLVSWWVIVIGIACLSHLVRFINIRFASTRVAMERPNVMYRWYQKHILIPACFGSRHMVKLRVAGATFTIPTRFETVVIGVYFLLNVLFVCVPYHFLDNDPLYPTHWKAMMRYVSDRTGIIGVIQMPLLVLFALRNNILMSMTGWSFSTFNTYHRAVARVTFAQFIVHAITKHVFSASYGASLVKYFYPLPYYRWGVAAIFLMVIMIITAMVRSRYYEIFLRLHILCGIGAFVCTIYHLNGLGYKQTVYVSCGLWATDWVIRLGRILFLNVTLSFSASGSKATFAHISVINGDVVNVRIRTSVLWRPKPGQYIFIHVNRLRFWEAHPFSVVGPSSDCESFQLLCKARGGMTKDFCQYLIQNGCDETHPMTRSVTVEGPYGVHAPVERYQHVLLVAGGVGITGVLPYVEYLVKLQETNASNIRIHFVWVIQGTPDISWVAGRMKLLTNSNKLKINIFARTTGQGSGTPTVCTQDTASVETLTQISPVPMTAAAKAYAPEADTPLARVEKAYQRFEESNNSSEDLRSLSSKWQIPYDESTSTLPVANEKDHRKLPISKLDSSTSVETGTDYVELENYITLGNRPDLSKLVGTFFAGTTGPACVLGCGPPTMMDTLRSSVVQHIDMVLYGRTDYFEEAFSW
jgi:predicted ferric reductase